MYGDFGGQMAPGTPDMQATPQMGANGGI
jgi:hypothetical protein